jgi:hypothetical protein
MARVSFTRTRGKEPDVEYIRGTLSDGEELVLLDGADADLMVEGLDPRGTTLQLRREALASQAFPSSKPTGH